MKKYAINSGGKSPFVHQKLYNTISPEEIHYKNTNPMMYRPVMTPTGKISPLNDYNLNSERTE
jgi:hypothetical protein